MPEELIGTTYEIEMTDGETIIIEKVKMDGKDDNGFKSCWKGYRKVGTKVKGGKEVNNCVKAGYEAEGDEDLQEKVKMDGKDKAKKDPCWKGYEMIGMKKKGGREVPNCVKAGYEMEGDEELAERKDMPGRQEKLDANKNGQIDAHDFALLRARKNKKSVKEMWEKAAEVQEGYGKSKKKDVDEGKKAEIEVMPEVDTHNDSEPPTGKKAKKEVKKEEFEPLEEKKLSKAETVKKEKFVKGMKKKFDSFKSKYGERAKEVMYGTATAMAKKVAK
jgi:hypothetical protein